MADEIKNSSKDRDMYIDVIKGIGIFSIVIGHASWDISAGNHTLHVGTFVYFYHLAVFFFCSGYLYKDVIEDYWQYVAKKLKGLYKPFVTYTVLYMICRNLFLDMGILQGEKYGMGMWLVTLTNALTFNGMAEFLSAFWFLPVLFFTLCIYAAINYATRKLKKIPREGIRLFCYLVTGIIGLYTTEHQYGLLYNMQISYLMVPVVALGHYFACHKKQLDRWINAVGLVISFGILVLVIRSDVGMIELIKFMIINRYLFYPVTICGIYFCLCLGKVLCKSCILEKGFAVAGQMSFDIMALHFLAFKLVDYIACHVIGNTESMNAFPHTFTDLWPIYYIAGMVLPVIMKKIWMLAEDEVRKKIPLQICYDREV